jgi:hypothetical protein
LETLLIIKNKNDLIFYFSFKFKMFSYEQFDDRFEVVDVDDVNSTNLELGERRILFNRIDQKPDVKNIEFPDLIYTAEIKENLSVYTLDFDLMELDNPNFFVELIYGNYNTICNKKNNGNIILFLYTKPLKFLNKIISELGYGITNCDHENAITLIYFSLYIGSNIDINIKLRNFIVINDNNTIVERYQKETNKKWKFPRDRATIIYTFYNKCVLPITTDYTLTQKYEKIISQNSKDIYNKCKYIYNNKNSFLSPIRYMCSVSISPLEGYLNYSVDDLVELMKYIEYIPIDFIAHKNYKFYEFSKNSNFMQNLYGRISNNNELLIKFFLRNIGNYKNLILKLNSNDNLHNKTDLELLNIYKPELNYNSRFELINEIKTNLNNFHWRLNFPFYNTNNKINIITLEDRTITETDPLISYGILGKYITYNVSELCDSFRSGYFLKPDSINNNDTFSYNSIYILSNYLQNEKFKDIVSINELKKIITNNLIEIDNIKTRIEYLRKKYIEFDEIKKSKCRNIILDFFLVGLYAKYWKGFGYNYPFIWKDKKEDLSEDDYANVNEREVNCCKIFKLLIQKDSDDSIEDWKKILPRITYNWNNDTYTFGIESLYDITDITYSGEFCLSQFSNIGTQTGYALFKLIFNYTNIEINDLIIEKAKIIGVKHDFKFDSKLMIDSTHVDFSMELKNYE